MDPQLQGQLRSLIITLGAIAASQGWLKGVDWVAIAGAASTIFGFVWSWLSNGPTQLASQAAQSPQVVEVRMASQAAADNIPNDKVTGPDQ